MLQKYKQRDCKNFPVLVNNKWKSIAQKSDAKREYASNEHKIIVNNDFSRLLPLYPHRLGRDKNIFQRVCTHPEVPNNNLPRPEKREQKRKGNNSNERSAKKPKRLRQARKIFDHNLGQRFQNCTVVFFVSRDSEHLQKTKRLYKSESLGFQVFFGPESLARASTNCGRDSRESKGLPNRILVTAC